jgi:hypothetical protein
MTLEELKKKTPGWFTLVGGNMRTVYYIEGDFSVQEDAVGTKFLMNERVFSFSKLSHEKYDVGYETTPYIGPTFIVPLVDKTLDIEPYSLSQSDKHNVITNLFKK